MSSNLTEQDILTVGASYWLNQRADGKGVIIAGVMRDTALGRDVVKSAIKELETKHKEWLEEYKTVTESEAIKLLAEEQIIRLRSSLSRSVYQIQSDTMPFVKRINRRLLADVESPDINDAKTKEAQDLYVLKLRIQAVNLDQAIGRVSRLVGIVERLEIATKPITGGPVGSQVFNFGLKEEETKQLADAIARTKNRIDAATNGS